MVRPNYIAAALIPALVSSLPHNIQQILGEIAAKVTYPHHIRAGVAEIAIYTDSDLLCAPAAGPPTLQFNLPINKCVSADLPVNSNIHIRHPGVCPGGREPRVSVYGSSDCTGGYTLPEGIPEASGVGYCLNRIVWGSAAPRALRWSMALLCHDVARQPIATLEITLPGSSPDPNQEL